MLFNAVGHGYRSGDGSQAYGAPRRQQARRMRKPEHPNAVHPINQGSEMTTSRSTTGERPLNPFIDVQKALKGASYPADRNSLIDTAKANGADAEVLRRLQELPDRQYRSPAEVSRGVGDE